MPYENLKQMLNKAKNGAYAVPAFNILNHITARAVTNTCARLKSPVILQTSVATVKQCGVEGLAEFIVPMAKNAPVPVAVHLDHCRDADLAKACIDAGWSSVMVDYSHLPLAENIANTRAIADYAAGRATVEGELGAVSGVEDDISVAEGEDCLADAGEAVEFVATAGIDVFAPAIGTAHGFYKHRPNIDFGLFEKLAGIINVPLVIHGGTGLDAEVFKKLVALGAAKINISSAIKKAYVDGAAAYLKTGGKNPLEMDAAIAKSVDAVVEQHIKIFGSEGRA